jgi:DNA/RNA-binding domain of Phe-tRNA-synthetase-like protein
MSSKSIVFETGPPGTSVTVAELDNLKLSKSSPEFEEYESTLFETIRSNNALENLRYDTLIRSYRTLHWSYSMDPTKTRVSSEAVLRRVLQRENLWRISTLVDVVNLVSAYHKIPIGLIDASKIQGQLTVRKARNGEVFQRIGGEEVECRGGELVLSDDSGIVCYGFAIHDSERTKITHSTRRALLLLYGAPDATEDIMNDATSFTLGAIRRWVDCTISEPVRYAAPA